MASLIFKSEKYTNWHGRFDLTIFTPTYNRKDLIIRTYESLLTVSKPLYKDKSVTFEWIIVDDGSTDRTNELVKLWCEENKLPIRYYWQENQGKHVAMNFAMQQACGDFWLTIDSDDTILPNALEVFFSAWESVDEDGSFCAVAARCKDENGRIIGDMLPISPLDVSAIDLRLKYGIRGEMLEMYKTKILKQYRFPTYDARMRFCPENIVWFEMAKKYKMRVVDKAFRGYHHDASNSLVAVKNERRSVANYYMWLYYVNNLSRFLFVNPVFVLKAYIGISMDGLVIGKYPTEILMACNTLLKRVLVGMLMPVGFVLSKFK